MELPISRFLYMLFRQLSIEDYFPDKQLELLTCCMAKYEPIEGSTYVLLPKTLANKRQIINVKNDNDICLEWAIKSALYEIKKHPRESIITKITRNRKPIS